VSGLSEIARVLGAALSAEPLDLDPAAVVHLLVTRGRAKVSVPVAAGTPPVTGGPGTSPPVIAVHTPRTAGGRRHHLVQTPT
jgi:hypothetical protein